MNIGRPKEKADEQARKGGTPRHTENAKSMNEDDAQGEVQQSFKNTYDDDRTVPVTQSRMMVEAGKKAGTNIVYVEVPGGSHTSIAAPQFGAMLDFFAKQKKAAAE